MSNPRLFAKRPSTVEAWQWDGTPECADLIIDWVINSGGPVDTYLHPNENLIILGQTTQTAPAKPDDWIVRDKFNEFWPIEPALFRVAYDNLLPHAY